MPKKFDPQRKARAVRMVRQHLSEYGSVTKTSEMVGKQLDISSNTLRRWVVQADIADGQRDGVPSDTLEELAKLKAENRRLRETNEIFAQNLDVLRLSAARAVAAPIAPASSASNASSTWVRPESGAPVEPSGRTAYSADASRGAPAVRCPWSWW